MEIKLNGITLNLDLYGTRAEIIYENRNNKSLDLQNMTTKMIAELFYCIICANLEKKKLNILSFDEFLTALEDENNGDTTLMSFWIWYVKTKQAQNDLLFKEIEDLDEPKKNQTKQ